MSARRSSLVSLAVCAVVLLAACDDKKAGSGGAASASASATPTPIASASAVSSAAPPASASAAAPAGAAMITGDAKDVVMTVKDPTIQPEMSAKAQAGGSLTLFLPDYPGTVWSIEPADKAFKAKEEVIPGFAPKTNGHQFKWEGLKGGAKHKVQFVNKKVGDKTAKPSSSFTLTIEVA